MLLEAMAINPHQRVGELSLLNSDERHQLLVEWNKTAHEVPCATLPELFAAQVAKSPDAIAVVIEDQRLSYGELDRRANQLAHHLRALGVGPEMVVGLCLERSLDMVVGLLGILKAGGAYLPLDPAYPRERLAFMLEDAGAPGAGHPLRPARSAVGPWRAARAPRCRRRCYRPAARSRSHHPARPAQHRLCHLYLRIYGRTERRCRYTRWHS